MNRIDHYRLIGALVDEASREHIIVISGDNGTVGRVTLTQNEATLLGMMLLPKRLASMLHAKMALDAMSARVDQEVALATDVADLKGD